MDILVIGGGGREHAIVKKLKENPGVGTIYALPGNGGMTADAVCVPEIGTKDISAQVEFAKAHQIGFAVVAPDDPLVLGAVDALEDAGIPCFGPEAKAAVIEGSKVFSKNLMKKYGIPTAQYEVFEDAAAAQDYVKTCRLPIVIKADGLALGKGVLIAETREDALRAVETIMLDKAFGDSGNQVVIENNEYGYWIDEDGEYEQLVKDLEGGQPVSREPVYTTAGNGRDGDDDLVNGYVEVDLTGQHLWFYYEGELILDTDVVTGQPVGVNKKTGEQEDWSTYEGSYPIAYTEHPATLSSDIYGYEVDVQYWMPFVYGQGLHDASWRSAFGGNIYQTDGSHGCVNLPPQVAATIYDYIDAGFPIILYK